MLTQEDDVDAHALRKRLEDHRDHRDHGDRRALGHDRKTIRAYLNGERTAGVRAPAVEDRFARFVDYCRERLVEDESRALMRRSSCLGDTRSSSVARCSI